MKENLRFRRFEIVYHKESFTAEICLNGVLGNRIELPIDNFLILFSWKIQVTKLVGNIEVITLW